MNEACSCNNCERHSKLLTSSCIGNSDHSLATLFSITNFYAPQIQTQRQTIVTCSCLSSYKTFSNSKRSSLTQGVLPSTVASSAFCRTFRRCPFNMFASVIRRWKAHEKVVDAFLRKLVTLSLRHFFSLAKPSWSSQAFPSCWLLVSLLRMVVIRRRCRHQLARKSRFYAQPLFVGWHAAKNPFFLYLVQRQTSLMTSPTVPIKVWQNFCVNNVTLHKNQVCGI